MQDPQWMLSMLGALNIWIYNCIDLSAASKRTCISHCIFSVPLGTCNQERVKGNLHFLLVETFYFIFQSKKDFLAERYRKTLVFNGLSSLVSVLTGNLHLIKPIPYILEGTQPILREDTRCSLRDSFSI